jgi:signal transduction histidine kinase
MLIDTLLDVTRVQMGRPLPLDRRTTDLVAVARQVVEDAQRQTSRRHALRLDAAVPAFVGCWDPGRLERMLGNLVNNAVKYSPEGGEVTVGVAAEPSESPAWAVLTVRDRGVGIPGADLPRVFERFYRASNVATEISGTGIGLTTVRQIVEQHGGRIGVESEEGRGTTWTVRLPLQPDATPSAPPSD